MIGFWPFAGYAVLLGCAFWIGFGLLVVVVNGASSKPCSGAGEVWKFVCGCALLFGSIGVLWLMWRTLFEAVTSS
jgi:hypothetical protein